MEAKTNNGGPSAEALAKMELVAARIRELGLFWDMVASHEISQIAKPQEKRSQVPDNLLLAANLATQDCHKALGIALPPEAD